MAYISSRNRQEKIEKLKQRGHHVEIVGDFDRLMGHAGAIVIDEEGFLQGGADPRGDGAAVGI
ncbi:gamma-glutamyltransferase [Bacillus nakamurai]|uniref:gamma-glutamyltransferase n=1 Tax=Bacillus nakamurai TaxID=1793963 RepID=UPI0020C4CCDD|nr:gamma-glutamyltransferase [Bacillus nakamurai]MCP6683703.1 gamma-glutamyltransferase [Bacillus nakamurai]